jgi:hypothetical protein
MNGLLQNEMTPTSSKASAKELNAIFQRFISMRLYFVGKIGTRDKKKWGLMKELN